jgi:hypothetical protein
LARRGLENELNDALQQIGWELRGGKLVALGASVRELFFPDGTHHDAYVQIRQIMQTATTSIDLVDPYVDGSVLTLFTACAMPGMHFCVLTAKSPADFALEASKWRKQHTGNSLDVRTTGEFHDRFLIVDKMKCWHIGASVKDAGNKVFMLSQVEDNGIRASILQQVQKSWASATVLA